MFKERRHSPRLAFNRYGRIQVDANGPTRDCLIVNLSHDGVRLHCDVAETLGNFWLIVDDAKRPRRSCRVIWRIGLEIGAAFTDVVRAAPRAPTVSSAA
jgi:PilZ domain-containing protein